MIELKKLRITFRFYICCDKCQDWFHGKCVGILQSEADFIDEYICPKCQKNTSINFANMKDLNDRDFELLSGFLKDISVINYFLNINLALKLHFN